MQKVKMSDVAGKAGVDLSTVSRVLGRSSKKYSYAEETIQRVREVAEELGYRPSLAARSLRTGKSMILGVLVSDIRNPFFSELASYLDTIASQHGYGLMISNTGESPDRQVKHIDSMIGHGVDGLIVCPSEIRGLENISRMGRPLVTVDHPLKSSRFSFVGLDNVEAGRMLARKLLTRGYRHIGVVVPATRTDHALNERLEGLCSELSTAGISPAWIERISPLFEMAEASRKPVMAQLEKMDEPLDAVLGMSNVCTLRLIHVLRELKRPWGRELGVVGIDDFEAASLLRPAITVIRQPMKKIAEEAFGLILKQMQCADQLATSVSIRVRPEWVDRESLPNRSQ